MSAAFFDTIGEALVKEIRRRRLARPPLGLVVHIDSWEHPRPHFDVQACPANSRGFWGTRDKARVVEMRPTFNYIDVVASRVDPSDYAAPENPDAVDEGEDVVVRVLAADLGQLTHLFPKLMTYPNITLDADYSLRVQPNGDVISVYLNIFGRFSRRAKEAGYSALNEHLLPTDPTTLAYATPAQEEKTTVVSDTDEEERRRRTGKRSRNDDDDEWDYGADDDDDDPRPVTKRVRWQG